MRRIFLYSIFASVFSLASGGGANAQDHLLGAQGHLIPAGTLLHCTLDEPSFSSATVTIGDPFVCALKSGVNEFGRAVLPRGSYLAGHLEAAKEPGHFVGKGYLTLQFDRVCLPDDCLPVPSKIIAVRGYRVDKKGEVIGHGHAKRDTVEWLMPPLWPWKLVTLPARGPRPTLKGEVPVTLRLMDDLEVPWARAFAETPNRPRWTERFPVSSVPASFDSASFDLGRLHSTAEPPSNAFGPSQSAPHITYLPPAMPAIDDREILSVAKTPQEQGVQSITPARQQYSHLTLIALKSETVLAVESYRIDHGRLDFVAANDLPGSVDLDKIDWRKTSQLSTRSQTWRAANVH